MPYGEISLGQIASSNGLLVDGTKPSSEPMLIYHQWDFVACHLRAKSQEVLKDSIHKKGIQSIT